MNRAAKTEAGPVTEVTARVAVWLEHVRALAEGIGLRLPTSRGEAKAAEYCRDTLSSLGYDPKTEEFPSTGSVFMPHLVAASLFLLAFVVYPLFPPVSRYLALAVTSFALFSETMEITLRPHPVQMVLPKRPSRNVLAVAEPAGGPGSAQATAPAQDIVVIGHMDSQHTPIIFSSKGWMAAYRLYSTLAFVAFVIQEFLYVGGAFGGWTWAWPASAATAFMALLLVALTLQAELSPSTHGANDNATAAGLVLTLAEDLRRRPLGRSRVWLVCSGSEEALHEGAKSFFARHKGELQNPRAVVLEMLGCAGPAWLIKEGFVLPLPSHPSLRRVAERVAASNADLGAHGSVLVGGVTEMSDAILAGVPAITLIGLGPDGSTPYWHQPADTVDKIDASPGGAMERNYRFVKAFLEAVDAGE